MNFQASPIKNDKTRLPINDVALANWILDIDNMLSCVYSVPVLNQNQF